MPKKWYLSKTLWITVATYVSEVILLATSTLPLTPEVLAALGFINGAITIALRLVTTQPLKM